MRPALSAMNMRSKNREVGMKETILDILIILALISIIFILITAWRAEDRGTEIKGEQARITERLDDLDNRLKAMDKTIVEHWKRYGKGR